MFSVFIVVLSSSRLSVHPIICLLFLDVGERSKTETLLSSALSSAGQALRSSRAWAWALSCASLWVGVGITPATSVAGCRVSEGRIRRGDSGDGKRGPSRGWGWDESSLPGTDRWAELAWLLGGGSEFQMERGQAENKTRHLPLPFPL